MSEHQTGPQCRRIPHKETHTRFQAAILHLLPAHNALGLGLHRQPSYNHYISPSLNKRNSTKKRLAKSGIKYKL